MYYSAVETSFPPSPVGKKAGKICEAKIYFIFVVIGSHESEAFVFGKRRIMERSLRDL